MKNDRALGFLALLSTAAIYGFFDIFIRFLSAYFSPIGQIAIRFFLAFLLISLVILIKRIPLKLPKINKLHFLFFLFSLPLGVLFLTLSILEIKVSNSIFYFYLGGLFSSFTIGRLVFKEGINTGKIAALILAVAGLAIYAYPLNLTLFKTGVILGILAGVFDAFLNTSRKFLGDFNRYALIFYQMAAVVVSMVLFSWLSGEQMIISFSPLSLIFLLPYAAGLVGVGFLTLYGFKHFDLNLGTIIVAMELSFVTVFAYLFLGEIPTVLEIIGSLFLLAALITVNQSYRKIKIIGRSPVD